MCIKITKHFFTKNYTRLLIGPLTCDLSKLLLKTLGYLNSFVNFECECDIKILSAAADLSTNSLILFAFCTSESKRFISHVSSGAGRQHSPLSVQIAVSLTLHVHL